MPVPRRLLVLYASGSENRTLSYQTGWQRQLGKHPLFDCTLINLHESGLASRLRNEAALRVWRGDAVVVLHSVFSNACYLAGRTFDVVARLPQPKVFFIGNEYKLMPEKMAFAERLPVALLVSQSSSPAVHEQYRQRLGCAVTGIPNTGLDPELFFPARSASDRDVDLGFRCADAPAYLGHRERREIAEYFQAHAGRFGLTVDISMDDGQRFAEPEWAAFLNRCRGQLGTEAGGDYFDLDDRTRLEVNAFVTEHPDADFEQIRQQFFAGRPRQPLRILSGRNVEAAGTRTAQILFEGQYDGFFEPDVHYIPLKKDFSNADDAVRKFRDDAFRESVLENAYQLAVRELTYTRLIDRFSDALTPLL